MAELTSPAAAAGLRVAWFGHASGRRNDGLSTYSAQTVSALRARGAEVMFFSHRDDGPTAPSALHMQLRAWSFKTLRVPLPRSRAVTDAALRRFAPQVIHISLSFSLLDPWIVAYARRKRIPVVTTVHLPYADGSARGFVLRQLYRFHARTLRRCDAVVALSNAQRALLLRHGCDASRVTVLRNGVDTTVISPGESRLRGQLGARFVVAYLGRLDPEKRVTSLVRAFASLRWPDDHVLLIAGSGVRAREVREAAAGIPTIRMLGPLQDPEACVDLLRAADVFVLPSTAEGLSLSMLEAMAAGCAVVATDVAEDGAALGDAGLRVPVRNVEPAIAEALRRLRDQDSLRERLRARARARAVAQFSLHDRIDSLLQLYALLRGGRAAAA